MTVFLVLILSSCTGWFCYKAGLRNNMDSLWLRELDDKLYDRMHEALHNDDELVRERVEVLALLRQQDPVDILNAIWEQETERTMSAPRALLTDEDRLTHLVHYEELVAGRVFSDWQHGSFTVPRKELCQ